MSSRDPWEGRTALQPEAGSGGFFSLFRGPNLPFTLVTIIALAGLAGFIYLEEPFATESVATATTSPAVASTADSTGTTSPGSDPVATTAVTATTTATLPSNLAPLQGLALDTVVTGISFPVFATAIPGDNRIFVLERQGRVVVIDPTGLRSRPFIDLTDRVGSGGIENGLLGIAFHPDYASNGRFYAYYTDADLDSRLSEFTSSGADAETAAGSTESILFEVDQEGIRHRGGMVQFGPDGYLWVALGDGGLGDDSSQNLQSLQGNLLRIDVDSGDPYAIPTSNPYAGSSEGRDEIWAHGLRNPWRFDIDETDRLVYIGDVGQADWEEINIASIDTPGLDFGWPNFEATACYQPSDGCDMTGWEEPALKYNHDIGACSVTGGYVYRGDAIPELHGHYFYADWCNGMIRSFKYDGTQVTLEQDWTEQLPGAGQVASFGLDGSGELLVVDSNGTIYRIVPVR